jgi:ATP-dependent DNA ligase
LASTAFLISTDCSRAGITRGVQLYAFDILSLDGDDLLNLPLGPDLFRQACKFGLEGLVSKRRDRPYRAGRSLDWIKVKNRSHPALQRVK